MVQSQTTELLGNSLGWLGTLLQLVTAVNPQHLHQQAQSLRYTATWHFPYPERLELQQAPPPRTTNAGRRNGLHAGNCRV